MYQVIRNAEMKQEIFQNFKGKEPYGPLSLIICENKYYRYYCDEIEAEMKSKNEKLMNSIKNNDEMKITNKKVEKVEIEAEIKLKNEKLMNSIKNNDEIKITNKKEEKVEIVAEIKSKNEKLMNSI